jgi:hypothetical protein
MHWKNSAMIFGLMAFFALLVSLRIQSPAQAQGERRPAVEVIRRALEDKGAVTGGEYLAGILSHRERFDFEEGGLMDLGMEYLEAAKPHLAAVVFEITSEIFPQSLNAMRLFAHALYISGNEERSLRELARMNDVRGKASVADFAAKSGDGIATTAEEVIDRCLEATGGREAWKSVKTMVVLLSIQGTNGEQMRLERMYKRPCFFRQGLEGTGNFTATDGNKFWRVRNGQWSEETNAHIRLASMDQWLTGYEDYGISYEFLGLDHVATSPVYHLQRTFRDGFVEDLYFSASTHLLTEIKTDYIQIYPFMKSYMSQWNYKDAGGVKIPWVFIRNLGPIEPPHGGVIEDVKINVTLDDSLFLPPDYN